MSDSRHVHPPQLAQSEAEHLLRDKEVGDEESIDDISQDVLLDSPKRGHRCRCGSSRWKWVHAIVLTCYTAIFLSAMAFVLPQGEYVCNDPASCSEGSILRDAFRYSRRIVDYNFETDTAFKGPPVAEVNKAWDDLLVHPHELRLSEEQLELANISTIQLADGSGEYLAQPQAFHLLHCIFHIYKYAHPEFYGEDPQGAAWAVEHTDHCIDNLRMFVQCHSGGTGLSTFKWLPDHKLPWPVLSAEELCIDWDYFDNWVRERSIPIDDIIHQKEKHLLEHPTMGVLSYEDYEGFL